MFSAAIYESHGCLAQCFAPFWGMCNTAFNAEMFDSASNLAARCFDLCFALWVSMFNTAFIGIYHDVLHAVYFLFTMVVFFSLWCGLVLLTTGVGLGFCHRWRRTKWKARAVWINRRRYCVRRRRYSLSTTGSQNQYPKKHKGKKKQRWHFSPPQAAHSSLPDQVFATAASEQVARWQSWQDGIAHRQRLRGGGANGGLLRALQSLLQNTQDQYEADADGWLRCELQHLLASSKDDKALMHGMRKVLLQAETWTMDSAKHQSRARWNASNQPQMQRRQRWVQQSKVTQTKTNHNRWNKTKQSHQHVVTDEWHTARWRPRLQEFGPPEKVKLFVCNHELSQFLDQSDCIDWNLVVHASDMQQAQEAYDILSTSEGTKASIFVTGRPHANEDIESQPWLENAKWHRLAGHIGSKLQVRAGWLCRIERKPSTPFTVDLQKKRKEGTVVLRMVMDRKYCTNWNHIVKKPCEAARAWCVRQHAAAHATSLDAWNFQLSDDTVVKGLIRVKSPEIAQALFQQSGFEHQGARWFVEILQPDSSPQVVQWYPWDGEEDWNAYGTRCRQAAGQNGLVTGRHFPADAHMDDLQEFLTRHAFGEVEILEKARRKNGTTWTFKGTREDREELLQGKVQDEKGTHHEVVMTKAVRTRRPKENIQFLNQARRVRLEQSRAHQQRGQR